MKLSLAAALLLTGASALEWKEGKCRHQIGDKKSNLSKLEIKNLVGSWMQIYGEKNEAAKCKSRQIEMIGQDELGIQYQWLMKSTEPIHGRDHIVPGQYLNHFNEYMKFYHDDPTIADYLKIHRGHYDARHPLDYDDYKFHKQFTNYMQVIDTDYDGFLSLYHCEEKEVYTNKDTGKELSYEDAWDYVTNQNLRVKYEKNYKPKYEFKENITSKTMSKEEVHVLYRAMRDEHDEGDKHWHEYNDAYLTDQNVVRALLKLNTLFPEMDLDNTHEFLENDGKCFYSPFEVSMKREAHKMYRHGHDWASAEYKDKKIKEQEEKTQREKIEKMMAEDF